MSDKPCVASSTSSSSSSSSSSISSTIELDKDLYVEGAVHNGHGRQKLHTRTDVDYNLFRDSAVRYMGYANEVGESFRYQFPRWVVPTYIVAFGYCLADATVSGRKSYDHSLTTQPMTSTKALFDASIDTADVLLWQSLASVMLPGAVINGIVRASRFAVLNSPMVLPVIVTTWIPTGVGLGSIPFIVTPIDHFVDSLMDNTFRSVQWKEWFRGEH